MKIAFCTDSLIFQQNRILSIKLAEKYPGMSWISALAKLAKRKNLEVVTGDIAISNVQTGRWNPRDILIIQLHDAQDGIKLAKLGAIPFVLMAPESPLYVYNFYRQVEKFASTFRYRLLFSGIYKTFKSHPRANHSFYFPTFKTKDIQPIKKWSGRKFLVMVAANKYYQKNFPIIPSYKSEHLDWVLDKFRIWQSPIRKKAIESELVTKRLEAIEYFGSKNLLHLFGQDWNKLGNLPKLWQKRLKKVAYKLDPEPIKRKDKIKKIANYKFAVCFENTSYPGYVTEKIIDCFTAGVIPIYLGAPDITKFVPAGAFINMRKFNSFSSLHRYLTNINQQKALGIISYGRDFLKNPKGKLYNHENMAKFILNLAVESAKSKLRFYSQYSEDSLLWKIFKGKKSGLCIEIGSYNGVDTSNTLFFEKVGWKCILVEPIKELCQQAKEFRKCTIVNAAVISQENQKSVPFNLVKGIETLSFTTTDPRHIQRIKNEGGKIEKRMVPAITMKKLIQRYNVKRIDFITIDTEGSELEVLKGFDLNRTRPRFLIVENNKGFADKSVSNYLKKYAYTHVKTTGCNDWYAQKNDLTIFRNDIRTIRNLQFRRFIREKLLKILN